MRTNHHRNVTKRCPQCRTLYVLGDNGIKGRCDKCAGIRRDRNGYAWHPGENSMTLLSTRDWVTVVTITRQEAFGE